MFNLLRITTIGRVSLIVALMTGLMRVNPAQAANNGTFHVDESDTFSKLAFKLPITRWAWEAGKANWFRIAFLNCLTFQAELPAEHISFLLNMMCRSVNHLVRSESIPR